LDHDADDLVQEAALYVCRRALEGLVLHRDVRAWVEPVLRHQWLDRCRRQRWARDAADGLLAMEAAPHWPGLDHRESFESLVRLVAPRDRDLLHRRFGTGETFREISSALSLPLGTVQARLHRSLRRLARELRRRS